MAENGSSEQTRREADEAEPHSAPRSPVIYELVRRHGEQEMARPAVSLWWSGLAAGLSISFSLLAQAILLKHLPDAPWRALVVALGYPVGFLMVVLGRQQLFTENTITIVLPVMAHLTRRNVARLARMWSIVFAANIAGTVFAALFCTFTPVIPEDLRNTMIEVAQHAMQHDWGGMLFGGVSAGFLMATMVWLLPAAEGTQFHVVTLITWLIAVGNFPHIVAGSVEAFMLVANGVQPLGATLADFTVPVLIGNVIGGTALFGLIAYAQVMKEL